MSVDRNAWMNNLAIAGIILNKGRIRNYDNFPDIYEWTSGGTAAGRYKMCVTFDIKKTHTEIFAHNIELKSTGETYWQFYKFVPLNRIQFDYNLN